MKRFFLYLLLLPLSAALLQAGPAKRQTFSVRQADGTTLTLRLVGDESFHYYVTADGLPVRQTASGAYCYARLEADRLVTGSQLAHEPALRGSEEAAYVKSLAIGEEQLRDMASKKTAARNAHRQRRLAARRTASQGVTGEKKGLVILVNFSDKKMAAQSTQAEFSDMMNKEGYNKNGSIGSVHDYFLAQSYGQFSLSFDVVGPLTLSRSMAYYGANDSAGDDLRPGEMIAEACLLAKDLVDFSDYDWDGDGEMDQVYVIYAGYAESSGAAENTIWPHEWQLNYSDYGRALSIDGVVVNTYACSSELNGTSGTVMNGIGSICHEFSHCMGLPDFYDTGGSGNFGMDCWSVMDYGSYGEDGYIPCGYTSYERWVSGWLTPTVLDERQNIRDMKPLTSAPEAYIIYNEGNRNEYYLLENRQQESWDQSLHGHGMLVLHVDYDASDWTYNTVNNTSSHQRMTIVPADNQFMSGNYMGYVFATEADLAGDPYPGTSSNKSLTDTSRPAASLFSANSDGRKYLGKPVEEIAESAAGLISFTFMGGGTAYEAPVALDATAVSTTGFTANWEAVEGAVSYTLEVRECPQSPAESQQLAEDFSGFAAETKDGSVDISSTLDAYMQQPGWSGTKLFASPSRLKVGSGSSTGQLLTPQLEAPASGSVTVKVEASPYGANVASIAMDIKLLTPAGTELQSQQVTVEGGTYYVSFGNVDADYKVGFTSSKRFYVSGVEIYDGSYSASDFAAAPAVRSALEVRTFYEIEGTSHDVTGLTPGTAYSYRVKAVGEEGESAWSNTMKVELPTGIALPAYGQCAPVEVYTADGLLVRRATLADWRNGLPAGIYLLRNAGTVEKILLK